MTLTESITKILAQEIVNGQLPIGGKLATEFELCEQFQCSRVTIRRVLSALEKAGMIERRPGVGTKVISTGPDIGFSNTLSYIDDIDQLASDHQRQVVRYLNIKADAKLAGEIGCRVGSKLIRLSNLRSGLQKNDPPIVFTYLYFSAKYPQLIRQTIDNPKVLVVHLMEKITGLLCEEVQQTIRSVALPEELSGILQAEAHCPSLMIVRRYLDSRGKPLVITQSWHPGDRYAFSLNVKKKNRLGLTEGVKTTARKRSVQNRRPDKK